jgi:ElaB/YqjD/DUF883 family membrane-anchored ribosome-binding protein
MDLNNRESAADISDVSSGSSATAARMKKTIADKAADAKETVNDLGRMAAEKLEDSRQSTARALDKTAVSLHSGADQFSEFGHSAAERLHSTADYVRETDLEGIFQDLQSIVKRYPAQSLAAAAILGFLVARGLSRPDR